MSPSGSVTICITNVSGTTRNSCFTKKYSNDTSNPGGPVSRLAFYPVTFSRTYRNTSGTLLVESTSPRLTKRKSVRGWSLMERTSANYSGEISCNSHPTKNMTLFVPLAFLSTSRTLKSSSRDTLASSGLEEPWSFPALISEARNTSYTATWTQRTSPITTSKPWILIGGRELFTRTG